MLYLFDCSSQRIAFKKYCHNQDHKSNSNVARLMRMTQFRYAFIDCEEATHAEKYKCHNKSPEVTLTLVAERVLVIATTHGTFGAQHEQALVSGIGK